MATTIQSNRSVVENFGIPVDKDWECHICLDKKNEELRGHTPKKGAVHKYHKTCLNNWLEKESSCPECREPLSSREVRILNPQQALIQLELSITGILNAPKEFLKEVSQTLNVALPLSAVFVVALGLYQGKLPLNTITAIGGSILGYVSSALIRNANGETANSPTNLNRTSLESNTNRIQEILNSKPFMGAMLTTGIVGFCLTTGIFLSTSLPILIGGAGIHFSVKKLNEQDLISNETKDNLRKVVTVTSVALSLMSPLKSMFSLVIGSLAGAAFEANRVIGEPDREPVNGRPLNQ